MPFNLYYINLSFETWNMKQIDVIVNKTKHTTHAFCNACRACIPASPTYILLTKNLNALWKRKNKSNLYKNVWILNLCYVISQPQCKVKKIFASFQEIPLNLHLLVATRCDRCDKPPSIAQFLSYAKQIFGGFNCFSYLCIRNNKVLFD